MRRYTPAGSFERVCSVRSTLSHSARISEPETVFSEPNTAAISLENSSGSLLPRSAVQTAESRSKSA